jgi:uncharacterized protein DUF3800
MGPLVAIGGINVPAEEVGSLTREIEALCAATGFPPREEFKWSPGRNLWMHKNLVAEARQDFFLQVIGMIAAKEVRVIVVVEDESYSTATDADTPEMDVTRLFLERVEWECSRGSSTGFVIADRPPGGRRDEEKFLADCLETFLMGTEYMTLDRVAHNVVSTPSKLSRLLQVADVVTGCTLSMVAGEQDYAPIIFKEILPLFRKDMDCIGGRGVKIHPDFKYANLYHWLFQDELFVRGNSGSPLPLKQFPYASDPMVY